MTRLSCGLRALIISLGQSLEGRDLIGVRISDDANDNLSEPGVFDLGQHHAPSLNPDGAEYDIATGQYRFWRKNRQPNAQAVGTDNNRNYSYKWLRRVERQRGSETYRGPNPLSALRWPTS
jgi:murein tripeptide amidase MpaA